MIRAIAPQFFTTNLGATLAFYCRQLGFQCRGQYGDPPFYAIVDRDGFTIHFRCVDDCIEHPDKYDAEYLDAYISVADPDRLHAEFASRGIAFHRNIGNMPWQAREFVIRDCDGRLLCFGANLDHAAA